MTAGSRVWIRFPIGVSHHFSGVEWADSNLTPSDPSNLVSHCLNGAKQKGWVNAFLVLLFSIWTFCQYRLSTSTSTYLSHQPILSLCFVCGLNVNKHICCMDTNTNAAFYYKCY